MSKCHRYELWNGEWNIHNAATIEDLMKESHKRLRRMFVKDRTIKMNDTVLQQCRRGCCFSSKQIGKLVCLTPEYTEWCIDGITTKIYDEY